MNTRKIYFVLVLIYFLVDFSQFHLIIPGIKYLKLGFIAGKVGILFGLINIRNLNFRTNIVKYYLLFTLTILFTVFTSYSSSLAFNTFLNFTEWFLVYFVGFSICFTGYKQLQLLAKIIIITGIVVAVFAITHSGHGPGILDDENDAGLVLIMLLPFTFFLSSTFNSNVWRIISISGLGIILLGITATLSRGAMVGTLPTIFLIWFRSKRKIVSLAVLAIVFTIVLQFAPSSLLSEFESISDTEGGTAGTRRYYWELSIEMFKKKPILGVGPQCWGNAIWSGLIPTTKRVGNSTPHSIYFQLISEMGFIGTLFWISLLFGSFAMSAKNRRVLKNDTLFNHTFELQEGKKGYKKFVDNFSISIVIGMLGGLIAGAFLSFLFYSYLYVFFALVNMLQNSIKNELNNLQNNNSNTT